MHVWVRSAICRLSSALSLPIYSCLHGHLDLHILYELYITFPVATSMPCIGPFASFDVGFDICQITVSKLLKYNIKLTSHATVLMDFIRILIFLNNSDLVGK
jgi:hypothetical protein